MKNRLYRYAHLDADRFAIELRLRGWSAWTERMQSERSDPRDIIITTAAPRNVRAIAQYLQVFAPTPLTASKYLHPCRSRKV